MAFTIDEAFLPAILTAQPMTDEQFAKFCSEHPGLFFAMSAEGELIVMPPNYTLTAYRRRDPNAARPLGSDRRARRSCRCGWWICLPSGARRSVDAEFPGSRA
jgi:hypothetical protein